MPAGRSATTALTTPCRAHREHSSVDNDPEPVARSSNDRQLAAQIAATEHRRPESRQRVPIGAYVGLPAAFEVFGRTPTISADERRS